MRLAIIDGMMDLYVANNSLPNALHVNKGNGTFQDVTATVGLNSAANQGAGTDTMLLHTLAGLRLVDTTEKFIHIGHSLIALIVAVLGGKLSQYLHPRNLERTSGV